MLKYKVIHHVVHDYRFNAENGSNVSVIFTFPGLIGKRSVKRPERLTSGTLKVEQANRQILHGRFQFDANDHAFWIAWNGVQPLAGIDNIMNVQGAERWIRHANSKPDVYLYLTLAELLDDLAVRMRDQPHFDRLPKQLTATHVPKTYAEQLEHAAVLRKREIKQNIVHHGYL